jgi:hypothetical protein
VGRNNALTSARHDECDVVVDDFCRFVRAFADHVTEAAMGERPGEIIDPAIAFRLADDADDFFGTKFTAIQKPFEL